MESEPEQVLSDRGEAETSIVREDSRQFVEFFLQGQAFAVDIQNVLEVQKTGKITDVFHCPEFVIGVVNLRGNIIALLDIGLFFNLDETELTDDTKMIIIQHGEFDAGIVASRLNGASWVVEDRIQSPPSSVGGVSGRWLEGVVQRDTGPLMLLDVPAIFKSEEIESL